MNNHKSKNEERRCTEPISFPCSANFCAGAFPDWLEVNLLKHCNAKCEWCIEKNGFHPEFNAPWHVIADKAISFGAENVILLGGEPTLYIKLPDIIARLNEAGRKVWLTTNGSKLTKCFAESKLHGVYGVNISVHHYCMQKNRVITGLDIKVSELAPAIDYLIDNGVKVRLNCNCISGMIDTEKEIERYIKFARLLGVNSVRFAELKHADESFVNIPEVMGFKYGLTNAPFTDGCSKNTVIDGVDINFRTMCGLQTDTRVKPINSVQVQKHVLYYDGKIYDGWQTNKEEITVNDAELLKLMDDVAKGKIPPAEAAVKIAREGMGKKKVKIVKVKKPKPVSVGCHY